MAEVILKNISKRFGADIALDDVSMTVPNGSFVVLLGPTGAGKTTTLRMVSGLDEPDGGEVAIGGRPMAGLTPAQRDVAMVFQQYSLYPHLTVRENLEFPLKSPILRTPKAEIDRKVGEVAEVLQISHKLDNKATALSGGEMQRVSIGRALVRRPSVYLMDEPLSSLDAKLRSDLRIELKNIQANSGATLLYVTHDQIEAMTMADQIVVMRDGHIEQIGSPLELYDRPTNRFVASFIGSPSMNMLEGRVSRDGGVFVDVGPVRLPVPDHAALIDGRAVVFGVRPEHLELSDDGLPVTVSVVEPTGSETHVVSRMGGDGPIAAEVTAVFRDRHSFASADAIHLRPMPDHAYVFDANTGTRLT